MAPVRPGDPRVRLASCVNELMVRSEMTQRVAAERLGMPQPKVSAIRNYRLKGISLERLLEALVALDQSITISVRPRRRHHDNAIEVMLTEGLKS
jgi:predicted XRE-type DNA-binding protein